MSCATTFFTQFCCCHNARYDSLEKFSDEPSSSDEEDSVKLVELDKLVLDGPPLDLDPIVKSLCELVHCRFHDMPVTRQIHTTRVENIIDETHLHHEIKEILKAFYNINEKKERLYCEERISFLLKRYYQPGQTIPVYSTDDRLDSYNAMYNYYDYDKALL